jgi:hypothetical protein
MASAKNEIFCCDLRIGIRGALRIKAASVPGGLPILSQKEAE